MLVNLTPHSLHIFDQATPERVDPTTVTPVMVIPVSPDGSIVRLGHRVLSDDGLNIGVPVRRVVFGASADQTQSLPGPEVGTWYVVSTLVALAHPDRHDLLVPFGHIRDLDGHVIGSTGLARPVTAA